MPTAGTTARNGGLSGWTPRSGSADAPDSLFLLFHLQPAPCPSEHGTGKLSRVGRHGAM